MKNNNSPGVESIIIWNAALILGFIAILSLGSVAPLFIPAWSGLGETSPAQLH
jgi:hypothetical protein